MDYYGSMRHDYIQKEMYPNDHRVDYFPPKGALHGSSVKIVPKAECIPKFVSKIEGNAVEEGDRVFFEGIIDAQPHPVFSWYFNDEPVEPGTPGWEDAEIHDSRKMSTLIIKYAREYHMGKYTLVAENHLGHAVSNCDLIVRKKQFPPVFWQRLYNYEAEAGSRLVAEVEVGGWPVPTVTWFKEDEVLTTKTHTENYNGYPNKYVPDSRIEVIRLDQIRHCVIFHRIGESDSGVYSVQAVNPLGEAVCQAEFLVVPGEGGAGDLYLPEKWKNGNRLDWVREDQRAKRYADVEDQPMSDEERAAMFKRFERPLPRALEYLASLPDYYPKPMEALPQVPFKGDASDIRQGKKGGKPTRPSKFQPGKINHTGYKSDAGGRIMPCWPNPTDPNARDPTKMNYRPVRPELKEPRPQPPYEEGPPCPHVWESHESIEQLYKILDSVGCKLEISDINSDKIGNKDQRNRQTSDGRSYRQVQAEARKQVVTNTSKSQVKKFSYTQGGSASAEQASTATSASSANWKPTLDKNVPGAQTNAEDFTKSFMQEMYGSSSNTATASVKASTVQSQQESKVEVKQEQSMDEHYEEMMQYAEEHRLQEERRHHEELHHQPPALPPKTKIMFSPSRHLFSPTESVDDSDTTSVNTVEYVPVKEKVKMIAQQQEEIVRREEQRKKAGADMPTGGVRILPPSPVTVRKEHHEVHQQQQQHRVHFKQDEDLMSKTRSVSQQSKQQQLSQNKQQQQSQLVQQQQTKQSQLMQQQQQSSQLMARGHQAAASEVVSSIEKSDSKSSQMSSDEIMYEATAQVTSSSNTAQIVTAASSQQSSMHQHEQQAAVGRMIPRLEDKYELNAALDELVAQETHSEASYSSSVQQSSVSSRMTQQSAYSSMTTSSSSTMKQQQHAVASETSSIKTLKDSSYSTSSSVASGYSQQHKSSGATAMVASHYGNETEKPIASTMDETPSWVRNRGPNDSPASFGSPMTRRKINQSPAPSDPEELKYRTPPQTPFQPGFYKPPTTEEAPSNPFPLSPKAARSTKIKKEKSSESIASSGSAASSASKKMRRKKREAQRNAGNASFVAGDASDSGGDNNEDEEV